MPVIEGVVVAEETADAVLEAFHEHEKAAAEKAQAKFEERNLKRWKKLIEGIFVRERLQTDYKPAKTPAKKSKKAATAETVEERPNELRAVAAEDEEDLNPVASTSKVKAAPRAAKIVPNAALPRSAAELARAADAEVSKRARRRFGGAAAALSDSEDEEEEEDAEPYVPEAGPSKPKTRAAATGRTTRRSAVVDSDSDAGPSLRKRSTAAAQAVREALQGEDSDGGDSSDARAFEYEDGSD